MSKWKEVGEWLKANAGQGAALVGSLVTGNIPAAVAAGVGLISSATGSNDPSVALATLQADPQTVVRLRELALQEEASVREHIRAMAQLELEDDQAEHHETQETIRGGDKAEDTFVRRTRPGWGWLLVLASIGYAFTGSPDVYILGTLLAQPLAYCGFRTMDKRGGLGEVVGALRK